MNETTEIITVEAEYVQLGSVRTAGPADVVRQASEIATELANVVKQQGLATRIQGREFVRVEGWATLGAMVGVLPREVAVKRYDDGTYEAIVELIRTNDGGVIGRGSAICGMDESWGGRKEYARRSMAITRATGKAYRLAFSWIMTLAGYEPTPAEEIDGVADVKPKRKPAQATKRPAQAADTWASTKMMARWDELVQEAKALGLSVEPLSEKPTSNEVTKRGKELAALIREATPKADGDTIATVILEGLSENIHSVNGALKYSDLTTDNDQDTVLEWFRQYRASRDTGADTPEAATIANTWLASVVHADKLPV